MSAAARAALAGFIEAQREVMAFGPEEAFAFAAYAAQAANDFSTRTYPWKEGEE